MALATYIGEPDVQLTLTHKEAAVLKEFLLKIPEHRTGTWGETIAAIWSALSALSAADAARGLPRVYLPYDVTVPTGDISSIHPIIPCGPYKAGE